MQTALPFAPASGSVRALSPLREFGAYEALWLRAGMTSHRLAPSDLATPEEAGSRRALRARL